MCNCIKKYGISEMLVIAKRHAIVNKENIIVYQKDNNHGYSTEECFGVHKAHGAIEKYSITKDGTITKL